MQIKGCKSESEKQEVGGWICGQRLLRTEHTFLFSLDTQLDEVSQQGAVGGGGVQGTCICGPFQGLEWVLQGDLEGKGSQSQALCSLGH